MKTKYLTKAQLEAGKKYRFITSEDKPSDLVLWWEWQYKADLTPGAVNRPIKTYKVQLASGAIETLPNIQPKLFLEVL